jgi:hypothetical protein
MIKTNKNDGPTREEQKLMDSDDKEKVPPKKPRTKKTAEPKLIKGNHLGGFDLIPAAPDTCPECGVAHDPRNPHNQQSLFYQYKFYNDTGRWPTWEDAMAHCSDTTKKLWAEQLKKHGIEVNLK